MAETMPAENNEPTKPPFKIIAHRGASADAPDNNAHAFTLALEQDADLIETDVRITADGVLVLEHDAEIAGLEVRYNPLSNLREQKPDLLTVAQAVKQFGERIPFCFEFKAPDIENALVYLLKDLLPEALWRQTEFTSFSFSSAVVCQRLLASLGEANPVGWLTRQWSEEVLESVRKHGLAQICPPAATVLEVPYLVRKALDSGLEVRVWLVETPEQVPALANLGVYGGTVNFPGRARAALSQKMSAQPL